MQLSNCALEVRTNCCNPWDNLSSKVKDNTPSEDKSKRHILRCQNTYNQFSKVEKSSVKIKTNLKLRTVFLYTYIKKIEEIYLKKGVCSNVFYIRQINSHELFILKGEISLFLLFMT